LVNRQDNIGSKFAEKSVEETANLISKDRVAQKARVVAKLSDEDLVKTFAGGRYTSRVLEEDMILYRAGSSDLAISNYFSKDKPKSVVQVRMDKAIMPVWPDGGESIIDTVYTIKIPAGTVIHTGKVSSYGGHFVGGTQQVVIEREFHKNLKVLNKQPLK
jgi:hypothetical protein